MRHTAEPARVRFSEGLGVPSSKATMNIVILWEHEVRLAAKAFAHLQTVYQNEDATDDERSEALRSAVNAGIAALAEAERENSALVLSSRPGIRRGGQKHA